MKQSQLARNWYLEWRDGSAARKALKLLADIGGKETHIDITRERVARACFSAYSYQPQIDPGEIYRNKVQAEKKLKGMLARSARILALSSKRNDKSLSWAMSIAETSSGAGIRRSGTHKPMPQNLVVAEYFSQLAAALNEPLPELDGGPFLEKFTVGNLIFDKAITSGRPVTTATMLAFELAFYFRMHTAGYAED